MDVSPTDFAPRCQCVRAREAEADVPVRCRPEQPHDDEQCQFGPHQSFQRGAQPVLTMGLRPPGQVVFKKLYPKEYTSDVSTRVSNALLVGKRALPPCAMLFDSL